MATATLAASLRSLGRAGMFSLSVLRASLPTRDQALAMLARVLAEPAAMFARAIKAVGDKLGGGDSVADASAQAPAEAVSETTAEAPVEAAAQAPAETPADPA